MSDGGWMFWGAIGIAIFVFGYAMAFGEPDAPIKEGPSSSLDL